MQNGSTALSMAAEKGHNEIVSVLVKADANVNLQTKVILIIHMQAGRREGGPTQYSFIMCLPALLITQWKY